MERVEIIGCLVEFTGGTLLRELLLQSNGFVSPLVFPIVVHLRLDILLLDREWVLGNILG